VDAVRIPTPPPRLHRPGDLVHWKDGRHARALGWADALGPGPFVVLRVVDKAHLGIPACVVLRTRLGEREINEVWLTRFGPTGAREEDRGAWDGYGADLDA
jgi:hypothetical protein